MKTKSSLVMVIWICLGLMCISVFWLHPLSHDFHSLSSKEISSIELAIAKKASLKEEDGNEDNSVKTTESQQFNLRNDLKNNSAESLQKEQMWVKNGDQQKQAMLHEGSSKMMISGPLGLRKEALSEKWTVMRFEQKQRFIMQSRKHRKVKWLSENQNLTQGKPSPWNLSGKQIIYLLHLHKSGGTSLCRLARKNVLISTGEKNCNVQTNWRCCGNGDTLRAQRRFVEQSVPRGYPVLVASEGYMYEAMDTKLYFYMVMLRNSRSRYLSHWRYVIRIHEKHPTNLTESLLSQNFEQWWKRQPDNFNFRHICGTRCMGRGQFQLTRDDFDYTVARLKRFDLILFLEKWEASMQKLSDVLSWTVDDNMNLHLNRGVPLVGYGEDDGSWDPYMSVLDDSLYEMAQRFPDDKIDSNKHTSERSDEVLSLISNSSLYSTMLDYFKFGPGRKCVTECCGKCSPY